MADIREILIQSFAAKIGRPPRRQPRKKIEGETQMKVNTSRGIAMRLICCAALILLSTAVAFSQTPKPNSGALLSIDGTGTSSGIHLKLYDSQIHSGSVGVVPVDGSGGSACLSSANDNI